MDNRHEQFLDFYQTYRHKDQEGFYQARLNEFGRAQRQAIITAGVLMLLTTMVPILTTTDILLPRCVWAALSVFLPALSTALTTYNSLFGFERQLKLYKDASRGLHRAEADAYGLRKSADEADYQKKIEAYVNHVEEVLSKERGQWGQLISEIKPVEPPKVEIEKK
jgi:conflict system pore-forming effector with SLATT domain